MFVVHLKPIIALWLSSLTVFIAAADDDLLSDYDFSVSTNLLSIISASRFALPFLCAR